MRKKEGLKTNTSEKTSCCYDTRLAEECCKLQYSYGYDKKLAEECYQMLPKRLLL